MPILRNAGRAIIDERKVRDYLLNPLHARGGHKARMFAAALGYRRFDHARLIQQIKEGILRHDAVPIDAVPHGERFRVEIPIVGPAGSAIVRTLWIVRTGEDVPRLTSAYPIK
jgi:filamentous hemagglutinin